MARAVPLSTQNRSAVKDDCQVSLEVACTVVGWQTTRPTYQEWGRRLKSYYLELASDKTDYFAASTSAVTTRDA